MSPEANLATELEDFFAQDLAQFEPDPDGRGTSEPSTAPDPDSGDPQWIVWSDAAAETAWAGCEFPWTDPVRH
jgi:hypothetical protein